jgi:hypothetical protein
MVHSLVQWLDQFAAGSEDLQLIVFRRTHHDPWVVLIPVEVADTVGEATVHEQSRALSVCLYV